jgi:hypothetical protein
MSGKKAHELRSQFESTSGFRSINRTDKMYKKLWRKFKKENRK